MLSRAREKTFKLSWHMYYIERLMDTLEKILFLVFGVAIGAVVVIVLTRPKPTATYAIAQAPMEISNLETWDMKELSDGTISVVVHRNVKRA